MFLDFHTILNGKEYLKNTSYEMFKEFQFMDYNKYKEGRHIFTSKIGPMIVDKIFKNDDFFNKYYEGFVEGFKYLEDINKEFEPNIGIYVGSFKPFHIGHYDILQKAEKRFDKVIIVSATNKNKKEIETTNIPYWLNTYKDNTGRLLPDIIKDVVLNNSQAKKFTIIRGIRNNTDLLAEQNYDKVLSDLGNQLPIIHILSDSKFSHISSSMIRELGQLNEDSIHQYIDYKGNF